MNHENSIWTMVKKKNVFDYMMIVDDPIPLNAAPCSIQKRHCTFFCDFLAPRMREVLDSGGYKDRRLDFYESQVRLEPNNFHESNSERELKAISQCSNNAKSFHTQIRYVHSRKILWCLFSVILLYYRCGIWKKRFYRLIIEGKRKKCSLLKIKSRTKIFCCRFVKKLTEKHDFRTAE